MRKHFLILMLLTLLPFTAWADDLTFKVGDEPFAGGTFTSTNLAVDVYLGETPLEDVTWQWSAEEPEDWADVAEYNGPIGKAGWYKATKGEDFGIFQITKANISTGWEVVSTGYDPTHLPVYNALHQNFATITSIKTGEEDPVNVAADAENWTIAWTFNGAAYNPAGTAVTKAGTYKVTVTATGDNANYTGSVERNFTVAKATLSITAKNVTITYGDEFPGISAFYDADGWEESDDEATEGVIPVALSQTPILTNDAVQTVEFTLLANELPNYTINFVDATATYAVSAKSVTVTPNWPAGTYTYGGQMPTFTANFTALAFEDQAATIWGAPTPVFYKYENETPGTEKLTTLTGADAGKYLVTYEGLNNATANYNVTVTPLDFIIGQKALAANMITLKSGEEAFSATYDKTQHIPTVVVKNGDITLVEKIGEDDGQYTVKYYKGATEIFPATATHFVAAGDDYKVVISAVEGGNYKNPTAGEASKTFTIARKSASLRTVGSDDMIYSAKPYSTVAAANKYSLSTTANLLWDGVVDGDLTANNVLAGANITLDLYDGETKLATDDILHAKNYTVKATIDVEAVNGVYPIGNYDVTLGNIGKVKIAKKPVVIHAKNQKVNYGEQEDEFVTATFIGADAELEPTASPYNAVEKYLWIGDLEKTAGVDHVKEGTGLVGTDTYASVFGYGDKRAKLQREEGSNAGSKWLRVVLPDPQTYADYTFTVAADSAYVINFIGGVQVWANIAHSAYKANRAALSAEIVGIANADMTEKLQNAVNASLYVDVDGDDQDDDDVTTANAGVYTIKFNQTKLAAAFAGLVNYDIENVENIGQFTANYTVDRAEVTVKALPQVRMVGEKVIEDASAATIEFEGTAPTGNDLDLIYGTLKLGYNLPENVEDDPATETVDESITYLTDARELAAGALAHGLTPTTVDSKNGVWFNGIEITVASFEAYNAANAANATATAIKNYTLVLATVNKAELTVTTDKVVTFYGNLDDNTNTLRAGGEYAGKKLNVKIGKIGVAEFKAGTWYMLSLPFAITPFEFCNDIDGYAIFDRLSTSGDALSFKISMDPIPAYTPFLVKFEKAFSLIDKTFKKVNVEAAKIVETEANNTWKVVNTVDDNIYEGYVAWLEEATTGGIQIAWATTGIEQRGFRGYITTVTGEQPAARPVIYIEEPDGSTTAISAITADGQTLKAEGWYTLNGVKLQSMPTEKGVYINNGKKVVLK